MIFRPELAAAILRGEKKATRRRISANPRSPWRAHPLSYPVGAEFAIQPGRGQPSVARAKVTGRRIEPLGALKPIDARREGFPTREGFVAAWAAINGSWDPDQRVHVIEFELVGTACMGCDGIGTCEGSPPFTCPRCWGTGIDHMQGARELVTSLGFRGAS